MSLNTLIAELEEALKAATPEPWVVSVMNNKDVEGGEPFDYNGFRRLVSDSYTGANDGSEEANARLIALMRNSLPTLLEALKRQREALEKIAKGKYGKCPIEGHWPPEKPCTLCGDLGFFDDQPEYDPAKDGHCVEIGARAIARAALRALTQEQKP